MTSIDLNADVGEGAGLDAELMAVISSANIACGAHAGDASTMRATMALARQHGVKPGAHPGFADKKGFGRRELHLPADELERLVIGQLEALRAYGEFGYVKPHGALYNLAARDAGTAELVARAIKAFDANLSVLGLAGGELGRAAEAVGLRAIHEAFADRGYDDAGRLVARDQPGALIHDAAVAAEQVGELVSAQRVRSVSGRWVTVRADSICLHGDNPSAVEFARILRRKLEQAGIAIRAFCP